MEPLYEVQTDKVQTVSRAAAKSYEKYKTYYESPFNLFGELGMFMPAGYLGDAVRGSLTGTNLKPKSTVEALRNPIPRIVEFYASNLLSGSLEEALPLRAGEKVKDADALAEAVQGIHAASNLEASKQVFKRITARDGQSFIKVVKDEDDVAYEQFIERRYVTDYAVDPRGNVTYIRTDVPREETNSAGNTRKLWVSEVWSKGKKKDGETEPGYVVFATTERYTDDTVPAEKTLREAPDAKMMSLADDEIPQEENQERFRFSFVPFVAVNARDTGEKNPKPVYNDVLPLMAWINKEATRLSNLFFRFNKAFKAIVGAGVDKEGRMLPPVQLQQPKDLGDIYARQQAQQNGLEVPDGARRGTVLDNGPDISIDGVVVVPLPGMAQMVDISPNIAYSEARAWISDHLRELTEAAPELLYFATESRANQSGDALRTLLAPALDKAAEMRTNLLAGLVKADMMALTISQLSGVEGFEPETIGTFENGDFDHAFEVGLVLPETEAEKQAGEAVKLDNAAKKIQLGIPKAVVMKELGYEEEAENAEEEPEEEDPAVDDAVAEARKQLERMSGGGSGPNPDEPAA